MKLSRKSVVTIDVVLIVRPGNSDGVYLIEFGRSGADGDQQTEKNSYELYRFNTNLCY